MEHREQEQSRRPFGVTLLTLLLLAYSALSVPFVLDVPGVAGAGLVRVLAAPGLATGTHVVLSAVAAVAAVGLWFLRRWGWVAAMLLAGPTLVVELAYYLRGEASYPYMALATLIALYLNSHDLRSRFFEPERPRDAAPAERGRVPA